MWISLRALSQTCKVLRELTLPLLWTNAHAVTIDDLGRLRETLRAAPHLASYIKRFSFCWNMNRTWQDWERYPVSEGSLVTWRSEIADRCGRILVVA